MRLGAGEGVAVSDDLDGLMAALPDGRVITDPDIVEGYRRDQTSAGAPGKPLCVVSARGTGEGAATMSWADEHGVPVDQRVGGTSPTSSAAAARRSVRIPLIHV